MKTKIIYRNYKNIPVGVMKDGTFYKKVDPSKHFMRIYNGYGISESIVEQLKKDGCQKIMIDAGEKIYEATFDDFLSHARRAHFDDPQLFCSIKWFNLKEQEGQMLLF